ncbi:expressed unknown protein [Seminavis robusta]|uniref:Dynamin N-terminal domain-containing protein n=1 Tax=Seminavis robusta TaxID=568900 RepID=A0A9N8H0J8_9STRA|nr:expressed unknown protein [Seminavis robusta]|eukprot:Sro3_g002310.1 n/a (873) ;mRNA; r:115093-117711
MTSSVSLGAQPPTRTLFDVKVALLGPVSAGKTTVLNALLGADYGRVKSSRSTSSAAKKSGVAKPKRTSTEVVFYRLFGSSTGPSVRDQDEQQSNGANANDTSATTASSHYPRSNVVSVVPTSGPVIPSNALQLPVQLQQQALIHPQAAAALQHDLTTPTKSQSSSSLSQRHVDVYLPAGDLFQMRQDTQLVLVDIPGLDVTLSKASKNAATTTGTTGSTRPQHCPYTDYVKTHWDSFDCIVIVLDVTANPTEQEQLLKFVKQQLDRQTRHPVLCLWNKLDDPYDPKGLQIIRQTQSLVNLVMRGDTSRSNTKKRTSQSNKRSTVDGGIPFQLPPFLGIPYTFGPPMTEKELQSVQDTQKTATALIEAPTTVHEDDDHSTYSTSPQQPAINNTTTTTTTLAIPSSHHQPPLQFLPVSAKEALVFKIVSKMTLEEFAPFLERDWMVERLGRDQIGLRRWNRLSRQEQIEESYYMLKDPAEYQRALHECGYVAVEAALGQLIGNQDGAQTIILETRMELSLRALLEPDLQLLPSDASLLLAPQLYSVFTKFQVLYGNTDAALVLPQQLQTAFWTAYDKTEVAALQTVVQQGLTSIKALAEPIGQLLSYHTVSKALGWTDGTNLVAKKMKHLAKQFLQLLFEQESRYDYDGWGDQFQSTCHQHGATSNQPQQPKTKQNTSNSNSSSPWQSLSPKDWITVWSSILLLSYDRHFCQQFSREKLVMEELLERARQSWKSCAATVVLRICPYCVAPLVAFQNEWRCPNTCQFAFHTCFPSTACNGCKYRFDNVYETEHVCPGNGYTYSTQQTLHAWMRTFYDRTQTLVPNFPALYNQVARLGDIPESLSHHNHVGHAFYQFCHLQELMLQESAAAAGRRF